MKKSAFALSALLFLGSCVLIPFAAAAAVGIWSYDEYSDEGGNIVVETTPARTWDAAKSIARAAGEEVEIAEAPMRIRCRIDEADVLIRGVMFERTQELAEIKVSARQLVRGRADIARNVAEAIANQL